MILRADHALQQRHPVTSAGISPFGSKVWAVKPVGMMWSSKGSDRARALERDGERLDALATGVQAWTPRAKATSQSSPSTCKTRSSKTISSGAPPPPCSMMYA